MTRNWQRAARRAQVLVFPYVRPATFALVMISGLALAAFLIHRQPPPAHPGSDDPLSPRSLDLAFDGHRHHGHHGGGHHGFSPFARPGVFVAPSAGRLTATVMASTLQAGLDGPNIPIAVGFALDGNPLSAAALGGPMEPGQSRSMEVTPGQRVAFVSSPLFDRLGAASAGPQVRSDAPGGFVDAPFVPRCVMALHGDAMPYPERPGYGDQPSLREILKPFAGRGGNLRMGPHHAVLAYEYSSHFHHPTADFQDLVLLITFSPKR